MAKKQRTKSVRRAIFCSDLRNENAGKSLTFCQILIGMRLALTTSV
jgi:hypothetical protein